MAPSSFSSGSALASLVALSIIVGDGSAYVSVPSSIARHCGRSYDVGALSSSASSDFDDTHGKPLTPSSSSSSSSSSNPYIRIQKRGRHYDVQTAITTFQKKTTTADGDSKTTMVDLHAQIHFGDANYFQYFNDDAAFGSRYDKILYELIVEDKFLAPSISTTSKNGGPNEKLMQLTPMPGGGSSTSNTNSNPIAPTEADRGTANQYGLQCQVDGIQYCKEGWVHADLTREEFMGYLYLEQGWQQQRQQKQKQKQKGHPQIMMPKAGGEQPLWALASTSATYPGSELVTSLMRPLTTSSNSASDALTRRLFTHLFLPGDALSGWIRAILWFGVPSPELSIMLVDWSSLSYIGRQSRRRGGSKRNDNNNNNNIAPISPIAAPVFLSLLTGNWGTARRLVFGQVLVGGQSNSDTSKGGVLIRKRNERAMEVLQDSLSSLSDKEADDDDDDDTTVIINRKNRIALLYGAGHCRDLHRRLTRDEGMTPVRTEWRTAFRATAPRWGDFVDTADWKDKSSDMAANIPTALVGDGGGEGIVGSMSASTLESVAVGLVILPLYLLVGGLDWVSTMGDLGKALDGRMYLDGFADVMLYLVRHVALYVGISKFVVDWGGNEGIFEDDERA